MVGAPLKLRRDSLRKFCNGMPLWSAHADSATRASRHHFLLASLARFDQGFDWVSPQCPPRAATCVRRAFVAPMRSPIASRHQMRTHSIAERTDTRTRMSLLGITIAWTLALAVVVLPASVAGVNNTGMVGGGTELRIAVVINCNMDGHPDPPMGGEMLPDGFPITNCSSAPHWTDTADHERESVLPVVY